MAGDAAARPNNPRAGIFWMICGTGGYAGMLVLTKLSMAIVPLMELMFFRSAIGLVVMFAVALRAGGLGLLRTDRPWGHAWRGMLILLNLAAYFLAAHFLPVTDAVVLTFASNLFMTALSQPILGERVGRQRWAAVVIGFIGVIIVVQPSGGMFGMDATYAKGVFFAMASAVISALIWISLRLMSNTENSVSATFYPMLLNTVVAGLAAPIDWVTPSLSAVPLLLGLGIVAAFAQLITSHAYRLAPTAVVAPFGYMQAVWAFLLGWIIYEQAPTARVLAGGAIVVGAGLYILRHETRAARRP